MDGRRVLVTGTGMLSGHATDPGTLWEIARVDAIAAGFIPDNTRLADAMDLSRADASILSRHQILALSAVEQAWSRAGLGGYRNRLRGEVGKRRLPSIACVGGSSLGPQSAMEEDLRTHGEGRFSPYAISRWRGNSATSVTAIRFGLGGAVISLNAASASGAQILWMAATLVASGIAEAVVAVAADPVLPPRLLAAMGRGGSVAEMGGSRPLSGNRSGMTPSEGAACMILESGEHAAGRGAEALAEWIGGGCRNEAHHLQAPESQGLVLEGLVRDVLDAVRLPSVDWVSLHATGTSRYDAVEAAVLKRVFRSHLPWISAFKRTTGHALSASGLLESALLVEGLVRGQLPEQPHPLDEALGLRLRLPSEAKPPETALHIGQGMGGDVVVNLMGLPGNRKIGGGGRI